MLIELLLLLTIVFFVFYNLFH